VFGFDEIIQAHRVMEEGQAAGKNGGDRELTLPGLFFPWRQGP